ncbi:uncharacterized protein LOC111316601 [Durio zibethinus]|uniref:Uncharacterized protein LOC111316601 n=1 Tax=Durio zibethinus TaxID=66656 RepID=A0A6P6BB74_DURZI|nr:uncharacterized protein LOC111316601 [Durio zibethinus]
MTCKGPIGGREKRKWINKPLQLYVVNLSWPYPNKQQFGSLIKTHFRFFKNPTNREKLAQTVSLLSGFRGESKPQTQTVPKSNEMPEPVPGMNGAVEVPLPKSVTVFEFGSVAATADKFTLAGFSLVFDELEPCRWEILPPNGSYTPQFRVVF